MSKIIELQNHGGIGVRVSTTDHKDFLLFELYLMDGNRPQKYIRYNLYLPSSLLDEIKKCKTTGEIRNIADKNYVPFSDYLRKVAPYLSDS